MSRVDVLPYNFKASELKWQKRWYESKAFSVCRADTRKKKYYVLEMFMYPSGNMHMGHVRNYTIGDVIARYKRLCGYNVLHPMGWDAFGLPAENAAIEHKVSPKQWTEANIAQMHGQLERFGFSYDWDREIRTCDSDYYVFQQKIFLAFWKHDLIYRKESLVNWDPVDSCVLANEQVVDGRGWRSGALIEKRFLPQWFMRVTKYAKELLSGLEELEAWPAKVRLMQKNWIGLSNVARISFQLEQKIGGMCSVDVFSTRPETIFGATFLALSPDHAIVKALSDTDNQIAQFCASCQHGAVSEQERERAEKRGVFTGLYALHPFCEKKLPIYVANFVLDDYGTGAIFATPAHDERDFEFATKYGLEIVRIFEGEAELPDVCGMRIINSDFLNGLNVTEARHKIIETMVECGIAQAVEMMRLKDWGVSRQRYWGCPVPIIHCQSCGMVPSEEAVFLPDDICVTGCGENPLEAHPTWKYTKCPQCGQDALRETDTLDTFVDSAWYFLKFCSKADEDGYSMDDIAYWMPVDKYIGGIEHAVLHLLYARFFTRALRDCGLCNVSEPFTSLLTQGMVCNATYKRADGKWLAADEVEEINGELFHESIPVERGRLEKMSKSRKNGIDPNKVLDMYGADALRLFVVSDSPPDNDLEWNECGLDGCWRFMNRVWRLYCVGDVDFSSIRSDFVSHPFEVVRDEYVSKVTHAIESEVLNKMVAFLREYVNHIYDAREELMQNSDYWSYLMRDLCVMLVPVLPHLAEEIWELYGGDGFVSCFNWPIYREVQHPKSTIAVMINGKLRATCEVEGDASEDDVQTQVCALENVQGYLCDKQIRKVIYVPGKIINFVV